VPRVRRSAILLALVALALVPAPAQAASIAYIGPDKNVYLTTPDGSRTKQLTTDGGSLPYDQPSQTDDGTIVVVGEGTEAGDSTKFAYFLKPDGTRTETQPLPVPSGIVRIPALTSTQVDPQGAFVLYDWSQSPFSGGVNYATSLIGHTQSLDACALRCKYGWISPRWVGSTGLSLVLDPYLQDGVAVQPNSDDEPAPWFTLGTEVAPSSVDESGGRLVMETVDPQIGTILDVLIDKPTTGLVISSYSGTAGSGLPTVECSLADFAPDPAYPRLSPDGSQIAWATPEGVFVSPTPTETGGGACTLQPRLIAAGGTRPDWGPADVPADPPPARNPDCVKATKALARAKKTLKAARRSGEKRRIKKAKQKLAAAKAAKRRACS
jgi:hypothetical protein